MTRRIIVASADRDLTRSLAHALMASGDEASSSGHGRDRVCRAHNPLELELLLTHGRRSYDLILLDHLLGGDDLLSRLHDLRDIEPARDLPIFVLADDTLGHKTRILASGRYGVSGFVDRPRGDRALRAVVARLSALHQVLLIDPDDGRAQFVSEVLTEAQMSVVRVASVDHVRSLAVSVAPTAVVCWLSGHDPAQLDPVSELPKELRGHTALIVYGRPHAVEQYRARAPAPVARAMLTEPLEVSALLQAVRDAAQSQPAIRARLPSDTLALVNPGSKPSARASGSGASDAVRSTLKVTPPTYVFDESPEPAEERLTTVDLPMSHRPVGLHTQRRVPCRLSTVVTLDGHETPTELLNVSCGGVMVRMNPPPPIGSDLQVAFDLPTPEGAHPIEASGLVIWVGDDGKAGVRFTNIHERLLQLIDDYVDRSSSDD